MKYCIVIGLLTFSFCVAAQKKQTTSKTIHDDGKMMQVKLVVESGDLSLNYDKSFVVTGMSDVQKQTLVDHLIDSLGVSKQFNSPESKATAETVSDKDAVIAAVQDYVEGVYQADTSRIERSVAKHLAKRGYYTNNGVNKEATMTYAQLVQLTKRWSSSQNITESTPRKIIVLDVLDKIASAKLEAKWGIDYFHLAKVDGKWSIVNVLWQDYPAKN